MLVLIRVFLPPFSHFPIFPFDPSFPASPEAIPGTLSPSVFPSEVLVVPPFGLTPRSMKHEPTAARQMLGGIDEMFGLHAALKAVSGTRAWWVNGLGVWVVSVVFRCLEVLSGV